MSQKILHDTALTHSSDYDIKLSRQMGEERGRPDAQGGLTQFIGSSGLSWDFDLYLKTYFYLYSDLIGHGMTPDLWVLFCNHLSFYSVGSDI